MPPDQLPLTLSIYDLSPSDRTPRVRSSLQVVMEILLSTQTQGFFLATHEGQIKHKKYFEKKANANTKLQLCSMPARHWRDSPSSVLGMPLCTAMLGDAKYASTSVWFNLWQHQGYQGSGKQSVLHGNDNSDDLDNLESQKWGNFPKQSNQYQWIKSPIPQGSKDGFIQSQDKAQTAVWSMDTLLKLALLSRLIFFVSFFVSWIVLILPSLPFCNLKTVVVLISLLQGLRPFQFRQKKKLPLTLPSDHIYQIFFYFSFPGDPIKMAAS